MVEDYILQDLLCIKPMNNTYEADSYSHA